MEEQENVNKIEVEEEQQEESFDLFSGLDQAFQEMDDEIRSAGEELENELAEAGL